MSDTAPDPLSIAIRVDDPALADRLAVLLSDVDGIRVVRGDATAGLVLSMAEAEPDVLVQPLTGREREVVSLLAEGLSNKEIALRLGIAPDTAKFHVARVIDKLDATGRTDAVAHAARLGVIHL